MVFKSNPVVIDILDSFCHSLFTFSPFDYWYSMYYEVIPVPLHFCCKNQENIMGFMFFLQVLQPQNVIFRPYFHLMFLPVNAKNDL